VSGTIRGEVSELLILTPILIDTGRIVCEITNPFIDA